MKYGLLGLKLGYSKSKAIHESIYKEFKTDDTYELIEINIDELEKMVNKLRNKEYAGFNITIPYKEEVIKYVDLLSEEAMKIKAVNTIALIDDMVIGFNTDYMGFKDSLKEYKLINKKCYILGSGGAALAVYNVLNDLGANVFIVARDKEKVKDKFLNVLDYSVKNIQGFMIVNATNHGVYPDIEANLLIDKEILNRFTIAYDLIYNPKKTRFLDEFNQITINGEYMLVAQAVYSYMIWKNIKNFDDDLIHKIKKEVFDE